MLYITNTYRFRETNVPSSYIEILLNHKRRSAAARSCAIRECEFEKSVSASCFSFHFRINYKSNVNCTNWLKFNINHCCSKLNANLLYSRFYRLNKYFFKVFLTLCLESLYFDRSSEVYFYSVRLHILKYAF